MFSVTARSTWKTRCAPGSDAYRAGFCRPGGPKRLTACTTTFCRYSTPPDGAFCPAAITLSDSRHREVEREAHAFDALALVGDPERSGKSATTAIVTTA